MKRNQISKTVSASVTYADFVERKPFTLVGEGRDYISYRAELTDAGKFFIVRFRTEGETVYHANVKSISKNKKSAIVFNSGCFDAMVYVRMMFRTT